MNKIVFMSFANSVYKISLARLKKQIEESKIITGSCFLIEKDLDDEFRRNFNPYIYRRGYGYWKWKAYLAKRVFDTISSDDILIYMDAGVVFNAKAEKRLLEYIDTVKKTPSGILTFQDPFIEREYTKADCFAYFKVIDNAVITDTNQLWAGGWIVRKTDVSIDFINQWCHTVMNHFDLITDKKSEIENFPTFLEHRHDQSVFSVLAKLHNCYSFPFSELEKQNYDFIPFQPQRAKQKTLLTDIRRKLLLPMRYMIGLYLIKVKGFYFKNRIAW